MVGTILTAEYTFISRALETFSRMDHMLGHKTNLKKFNKIEIMPSIFSDHSGTKLEINHRKINRGKKNDYTETKQYATENQWVNNEIKEKIRKYLETKDNENNLTQSMGHSKSSSKREIYSSTGLWQEIRKI